MKTKTFLCLLSLFAVSCSNSTTNNGGPQNTTVMQWKVGSRTTIVTTPRDTSSNDFDMELSSHDTIIRTIVSTHQTFMGRSNVTIYQDSFPATPGIVSNGYMSQDNDGTVWIFSYGENAWIDYFNKKFIDAIGWVKCYDPASVEWNSEFDIGPYESSDHTFVNYSETLQPDDTVSVNGKTYTAKHVLYTMTTSTAGYASFFTVFADSYLVFQLGMPAIEIDHSFHDWVQQAHFGLTTRVSQTQ